MRVKLVMKIEKMERFNQDPIKTKMKINKKMLSVLTLIKTKSFHTKEY